MVTIISEEFLVYILSPHSMTQAAFHLLAELQGFTTQQIIILIRPSFLPRNLNLLICRIPSCYTFKALCSQTITHITNQGTNYLC
jgi:hypothetical protein